MHTAAATFWSGPHQAPGSSHSHTPSSLSTANSLSLEREWLHPIPSPSGLYNLLKIFNCTSPSATAPCLKQQSYCKDHENPFRHPIFTGALYVPAYVFLPILPSRTFTQPQGNRSMDDASNLFSTTVTMNM